MKGSVEEIIAKAEKMKELVDSGYAGCLSDGKIVDRREHPEATPMQQNSLLGIPKPKDTV